MFIHIKFFTSKNISIIFYEISKNLRSSRDYTSFLELNSKQSKFIDFNCFRSFRILWINIPNNKVFVSKEKKYITFFNCTVRKMQMSQQKYRSSRCLLICLLKSTSDDLSAPQTAQLTLVSGAIPFACALKCL